MKKIYKREMELSIVVDIDRFIKGDLDRRVKKIISKELREEVEVILDFNELNNKNDKLGDLFLFEVSAMESGCASKGVERFGIIRLRFGLNDVGYSVDEVLKYFAFMEGMNGLLSMSLHEIIPSKYKFNLTMGGTGLFKGLTLIEQHITKDLRLDQCHHYRPRSSSRHKLFTFDINNITHESAMNRIKKAKSVKEVLAIQVSSVRLRTLACKEDKVSEWNIAK